MEEQTENKDHTEMKHIDKQNESTSQSAFSLHSLSVPALHLPSLPLPHLHLPSLPSLPSFPALPTMPRVSSVYAEHIAPVVHPIMAAVCDQMDTLRTTHTNIEKEALATLREAIKQGFLVTETSAVSEKSESVDKYRIKPSAAIGASVVASLIFPPTRRYASVYICLHL